MFDRTENEPEEWDPEEEYRDPDSDSITIPKVPTEDAGSTLLEDLRSEHDPDSSSGLEIPTTETDAPKELRTTFWVLVLVIDAALLAVSLGLLFLIFEGDAGRGVPLVTGGVALFGLAVRRYRSYRASADGSTPEADEAEPGEPDTDAADTGDDAAETDTTDTDPSR